MSDRAGAPQTLAIDDVEIRYRIDGPAGAPWLAFSNSLMTDLSLWDAQVAALADRFRILRYDQRGHGGSSVPTSDCRFPRLVDDLVALLDHLGIAEVSAVGVSMGGVTALGLAGRHPDRVIRAVICDCQARSTEAGAAAWDERIALAQARGMAALVEPTVGRWFTPATLASAPPAVDTVRRMIAATPTDGFVRGARALQSYDFSGLLPGLACPALFLVGEADAALPQTMRAMAEAAPHGRYAVVAGAGHLPNVERPEAFDAAVTAFLIEEEPCA